MKDQGIERSNMHEDDHHKNGEGGGGKERRGKKGEESTGGGTTCANRITSLSPNFIVKNCTHIWITTYV